MISSFSVTAADNGYSLNYCIKTPSKLPGQYNNCTYDDKEEVFMKKDSAALLSRVSELMGILGKESAEEEAEEAENPLPPIKG